MGTVQGSSAADYGRFCEGVRRLCGVDLSHYRSGQMERRLRSFAGRSGHTDLDAYLESIRRDPVARDEFLDRMTINVSELFRNPDRFADLERTHIPHLLEESSRGLRVWSAACSYGAEPYSLAILLAEAAPGRRHEIRGTDIDRRILERAKAGEFSSADMRNVSAERRRRWFGDAPDGGAVANDELRRSVRFSHLDLLGGGYPAGMDLILCRNVVIYFTEEAKEGIYARLRQALRPGGLLMVGATEGIAGAEANGWTRVATFLYQRR